MYFLNFPRDEVFVLLRNVLSKYLSLAIFCIFYSVPIEINVTLIGISTATEELRLYMRWYAEAII